MTDLAIEPLVSPVVWLLAALASLAALGWHAWRRPAAVARGRWAAMLLLRSVSTMALLIVLLNPSVSRPSPALPGRPRLTVIVDDSASMTTTDSSDTSRFDAAGRDLAAIVARLGDRFDIETRTVSQPERAIDAAAMSATRPAGDRSDLAGALRRVANVGSAAGGAIVLLSDGIDNGGASPVLDEARAAAALDVPVYTRTYGDSAQRPDLSLELRSMQDVALVHQDVPLTGIAHYRGPRPVDTVARLSRDGAEIAATPLHLRAGRDDASLTFSVAADRVGLHRYEVALDPIAEGEATLDNNRLPYILRVVDEPLRAMLLEGQPYWDTSFLLRTLASDPAIAVDAYIRVRADRTLRRTLSGGTHGATMQPAVPADRTETLDAIGDPAAVLTNANALRATQIVIVGRDADSFLSPSAMDALRHWITVDGGALVCYRGAPTSASIDALASLLPVRWLGLPDESRGRLDLTDAGRALHFTFDRGAGDASFAAAMPALASEATATTAGRPLATVLATIETATGRREPAITVQPYGAGRVVVIEGAGLWRWSFLPPRFREREPAYAAVWQSLLRWLATDANRLPGAALTLRADKTLFDADEPATATLIGTRATTRPAAPTLVVLQAVDDPGVADRRVTPEPIADAPGLARLTFGPLPPGRYLAQIDGAAATDAAATIAFDVRRFGREMLDLEPQPELMQRVASITGGATLDGTPADVAATLDRAIVEHRERALQTSNEREPAWDRPAFLVIIIAAWSTAWAIRRRSGLT